MVLLTEDRPPHLLERVSVIGDFENRYTALWYARRDFRNSFLSLLSFSTVID